MSVKIVYEDIAAGAADDALVTTSSAAGFSETSLLPFGGSRAAIATLEPYGWILDGSREILDTQQLAFWSKTASDINGQFSTPPKITISFNKRYTSPGLSIDFSPATNDYCTHMTIEWYRGSNLLKSADFYPDGTSYFCNQLVRGWDKIVLIFRATNFPQHYIKLQKIIFGVSRTFLRPELRSVRVTQEVSVISDEVAVNTLDFTLDSKADIEYIFQTKQPMSAYDRNRLIGVFFIDDSKRRAKGLWDISCHDAIGVLDDDPYPARILVNEPARELLLDILGGHFQLDLEPSLANTPITGYLPPVSRRQALQQVSFALCAMVDTSGTDAIRVYKDTEDLPRKIPKRRTYISGTVDTSAIVTAVQVTAHKYSATGSGNDTVEVNGVTYYHTTEITEIANPDITASDKANVIEVKEATLVNASNVQAVAQHLYSYYKNRQKQRVRIVMNGEKPGDRVAASTPWDTYVDGFLTSMQITLSGIAAAQCEIVGVDTTAVGGSERIMSGEFMSGEV